MECIILAGGLGTRLQSVIGEHPKCMAPVNSKPFLHYVFDYLEQHGCTRAILSLGFKHEEVLDWVQTQSRSFSIDHVIEHEPLGTGGGISLALTKAAEEDVLALNGDTLFLADLNALMQFHKSKQSQTTLALKHMTDFERYGVVQTDADGCITSFEEKKYYDAGLINGGVFVINKKALAEKKQPVKYSFEKDYLEAFVSERKFFGFSSDAYFIDIGIPADYEKAQRDFTTLF
jgi:D-glycero-alpha-D-manno-heptose 1-phosphate guanylyltransferase